MKSDYLPLVDSSSSSKDDHNEHNKKQPNGGRRRRRSSPPHHQHQSQSQQPHLKGIKKLYMLYIACIASIVITMIVSSKLMSFFPSSSSSKATTQQRKENEYYVEISDSSENILPSGFPNALTELPSLTDPKIKYGYCAIGAGLSGSVFVERAARILGERSLIIDSRSHIGGNCYDFVDIPTGILRNQYGSHLFHTNIERVWNYVTQNIRAPKWKRWYHYKYGQIHREVDGTDVYVPIPPNIMTVNRLFDLDLKNETDFNQWLQSVQIPCPPKSEGGCQNAEQMAKSRVGEELYKLIFEGYTIKQWNKHPSELDASVTARIPVRSNFDPRYFNDKWQALPSEGYTSWFASILNHPLIDVVLKTDFFDYKEHLESVCEKIIYTGPIDRYFASKGYEKLEYRGINFTEYRHYNHPGYILPTPVLNYPGMETNYTRAVEQKQYLEQKSQHTIVVKETSTDANGDGDPYYPVPSKRNHQLYAKYQTLATQLESTGKIQFVGRLANYKYFNMDQAIDNALTMFYNGSSNQLKEFESSISKVKQSRRQFMIEEFYPKYKKSIDDDIRAKYQQPQQQLEATKNETSMITNNEEDFECRGYYWQGEFGKELRVMVPWAYSKLSKCKESGIVTQGNIGSKYLYFFSGHHKIISTGTQVRDGLSVLPLDNPFAPLNVHRSSLPDPLPNWDPPPFKQFFARPDIFDNILVDGKPLVVIQNKFNMEWDLPPINYFDEFAVKELLDYLTPNYTVLYKRHTHKRLQDSNEVDNFDNKLDLNEKAMIRRHYPEVLLFEDFADHIVDIDDFNLLLFGFLSVSERFISVQGGTAVVGSYFGGQNIILIKKGHELTYGDYNYFHRFSNANITQTTEYDELLETVQALF